MKVSKLIKSYMAQFDQEKNIEIKFDIINKLSSELEELKITDEKYQKELENICRSNYIKRKHKQYSKADIVKELFYMFFLRKLGYQYRKIKGLELLKPKEFFLGKPYEWECMNGRWNGYWGYDIVDNIAEYKKIYDLLEDEKSKFVYCNILMARLTNDWKYYKECRDSRDKEYFDTDILKVESPKIIVDGGGYIGDTYSHFCNINGEKMIKEWFLYEPDKLNFKKAKDNLVNQKNIIFRQKGIGEKSLEVSFESTGGVGSRISENTIESIEVVALDEDIQSKVDIIKLDIEGMELEALKGSRRHIINDKPTLIICLYHKEGDIRSIINYIYSINSNYKLYIRHYSESHWDTVLYAML